MAKLLVKNWLKWQKNRFSMSLKNRILKLSSFQILTGLFFVAGFFYSCNTEKKLAKEFVYQPVKRYALVMPPDFLYKVNQKTWLLDSIGDTLTDEQKDSLLWEMADFVNRIDDSVFLIKFTRGYNYRLAKYGFDVFNPALAGLFMEKDSNAFVINIPQIELEETVYPYKDEMIMNGYTYFHQHYLNALNISSWFEINKVNDTAVNEDVLFASDLMTDDLTGSFEYDEVAGQLKYYFKLDSLTTKQVYDLAIVLGRRYAGYTYDYLLNKYILTKKPEGDTLQYYWHYDLENNKLYPIWDEEEKFIPVD
jgi:hypothetical protein